MGLTLTLVNNQCAFNESFYSTFLTKPEPLRAAIQLKKVKLTGGLKFNDNGTLYHVIKPGVQQYVGPLSPEIEAVWDTLLESR